METIYFKKQSKKSYNIYSLINDSHSVNDYLIKYHDHLIDYMDEIPEIKEILVEMGLGLGLKIEGWPPPGWNPNTQAPTSTRVASVTPGNDPQ